MRYFSTSIIGFCHLALFLTACIAGDAVTFNGVVTTTVYKPSGEVHYQTEGSFELSYNDDYYRIRSLIVTNSSERGVLVISNYNEVYQSYKLKPYQTPPPKMPKNAFAIISKGPMPNDLSGGGTIQVIALAHLIMKTLNSSGELLDVKGDLVPDIMLRSMRQIEGINLTTQVSKNADGNSLGVFFGCDRPKKGTKSPVGSILLENIGNGFPEKIKDTRYYASGNIFATYEFKVNSQTTSPSAVFKELSYDAGLNVSVTDNRYVAGSAGTRYVLSANDEPPFAESKTISTTYRQIAKYVENAKTDRNTKRFKGYSIALLIFAAFVLVVYFNLRQNTTKNTK
jgi:hypothetical protein